MLLPTTIASDESLLDEDTVAFTTATTPLAIVLPFMPLAMQVIDPGAELQVRAFPTDVIADPAVKFIELISLDE